MTLQNAVSFVGSYSLLGIYTGLPTTMQEASFEVFPAPEVEISPAPEAIQQEKRYTLSEAVGLAKWRAYDLLDVAGSVLGGRVARCSRHILKNDVEDKVASNQYFETSEGVYIHVPSVELIYDHEGKTGTFGNVLMCNLAWPCPVCTMYKAKVQRERIVPLVNAAIQREYTVLMATFTLQHRNGDSLESLLSGENEAFKKTKGGREWTLFCNRYGLVGDIVANEIRISMANGWHPHKHVIWVFNRKLSSDEIANIELWVSNRYRDMLHKVGKYADAEHGVVVCGKHRVAEYVSKWGIESELTGSESKASEYSYSPFQLLQLIEADDLLATWASEKYQEYARATKGLKRLRVSKGLEELLLVASTEDTESISQREVIEALDYLEWTAVKNLGKRGELVYMLSTCDGDVAKVWKYILSLGVPERYTVEWVELRVKQYRAIMAGHYSQERKDKETQVFKHVVLPISKRLGLACVS